jgi:hypothetical protein
VRVGVIAGAPAGRAGTMMPGAGRSMMAMFVSYLRVSK